MKKLSLSTVIVVFLSIFSTGIQAQTVTNNLNQLKLMQSFVGTWQLEVDKDTVLVEVQQYGNAFVETDYLISNGKKSLLSITNYGFSSKEDKFNIFGLEPSGDYQTYIGSFTTEKKFCQDQVKNFNPEKVLSRLEIARETPKDMTATFFNSDGVKTGESKWIKVK